MAREDLWKETLKAKSRVEDQEAEAETARSAFHELIRQLNASGVSLREIAARVELSHQRVHQIVEGVACSFCDRRRAECPRMVAGPGVFICDSCTALGLHALAQGWGASDERTRMEVRNIDERCCFCRRRAAKVGPLATRGMARICGHCLTLAPRELGRVGEPVIGRRTERRSRRSTIHDLRPRAERALAEAAALARSLGDERISDQHLLAGLAAVEESVATKALARLGLNTDALMERLQASTPMKGRVVEGPMGIDPSTKLLMEDAAKVAKHGAAPGVGTEHLLAVLASESETARDLLRELGVDPDQIAPTIETILSR